MNLAQDFEGRKDCSLTDEGKVRSWPHFLADNMPTIITYVLGTVVLYFLHLYAAATFAVYCIVSTVFIWRFVCTHCQYFGGVCQCGFSIAATRLFKQQDQSQIGSRKMLLAVLVLPCWTVPPLVSIWLLVTAFSLTMTILLVAFILMAYVIAPYISWKVGCCDVWRYLSLRRAV